MIAVELDRLTGEVVQHAQQFWIVLSVALARPQLLALLVAALEVSVAAIRCVRGVDPASVNRTFKGDRAPALPGTSRVVPGQPINATGPKLPDGCVAAADWRSSNIYSDEVAGRCVA